MINMGSNPGLNKKRVLIIQRLIAPYRVPFYRLLKQILEEKNVELKIIYGQPAQKEGHPYADIDIGIKVRTTYITLNGRFLFWIPAMNYIKQTDLVIVQQANKSLLNLLLIPLSKLFGLKIAFWGHGRNFQALNKNSVSEHIKQIVSTRVNHWFAYTDLTKQVMKDLGYPEEKITSVNNSIDTKENVAFLESISEQELEGLRQKHEIGRGSPVGIFCSRLYRDKRIDFLIRCAEEVRKRTGNFHFFVVGDGVESSTVKEYADRNANWLHWVGAKYGREKTLFFKLADFQLMPGAVGLNIVESFALLTPLITTDIDYHGPEITYLENGINGVMTRDNEASFVDEIIHIIRDKSYHMRLVEGCRQAREFYTIENMATRFADGICKVLLC